MSYNVQGLRIGTEVAAADLSAKQFFAAKQTSTGINLAGAGEAIQGVIDNKPAAGEPVELVHSGIADAIAGAAVAKGAKVMSTAAGKFVTATTGNVIVGVAMAAAGADLEIFPVLLQNQGIAP